MATTYVVTACNRGLGLEFARQLSNRGDRVIATARDLENATELAALDVETFALDVADAASVERFGESMSGESDGLSHPRIAELEYPLSPWNDRTT